MFPMVLSSTSDIKTDCITQEFANVNTDDGVTTAIVRLHTALYEDNIASVVRVVSNNAMDTPVAESYSPTTRQLTVNGLAENSTRLLAVDYNIDALEGYTGLAGMAGIAPIVLFAGLLVGGGLAMWSGFKR